MSDTSNKDVWLVYERCPMSGAKYQSKALIVGLRFSEDEAKEMITDTTKHEEEMGWDHQDYFIIKLEVGKNYTIDGDEGPIDTSLY